jgi:hypothetical protein
MRRVVCAGCGMTNMGEHQHCLGCGTLLPAAVRAEPAQATPAPTPSAQQLSPASADPVGAGPAEVTSVGDPPTSWQPTHRVPPRGLPAYARPDPEATPAATLPAGLELAVVGNVGAWARIVCSNGWTAWVDARALVP